MKKKVTLSLDEDVVKEAKNRGLNMSKAANTALKKRTLLSNLSEGERTVRRIINDARDHENAAVLPMSIEKLKLENIGKFEDKELDFNGENVAIYGPNGSGKTTVFRALKAFFGNVEEDIINFNSDNGSIEVEVKDKKGRLDLSQSQSAKGQCLIIDAIFQRLSEEKAEKVIEELEENYSEQIIITTSRSEIAEKFDRTIKLSSITESRLEELEEDLAEIENKLEEKKADYRDLSDERAEIEEKYERIVSQRSRLEAKREELESLNRRIEDTEEELAHKQGRMDSISEEIEETDEEREKGMLEERRRATKEEFRELEESLEKLKEKRSELRSSIEEKDELDKEINKVKQKKERLSEQIADIREDIEELREEKTHLEEEKEEVESKL